MIEYKITLIIVKMNDTLSMMTVKLDASKTWDL